MVTDLCIYHAAIYNKMCCLRFLHCAMAFPLLFFALEEYIHANVLLWHLLFITQFLLVAKLSHCCWVNINSATNCPFAIANSQANLP